ncbi:MAG: archease [Promethearchaeota archaeon]
MMNYYRYLEHTADIRLYAVGETLERAFEQAVLGMINIMTDINKISNIISKKVCCSAPDKEILLVDYLTEYLGIFDIENLLFSSINIDGIKYNEENGDYSIDSTAYGEEFDPEKHEIRSEVKAVTFSYLEIAENPDKTELWIVLDL